MTMNEDSQDIAKTEQDAAVNNGLFAGSGYGSLAGQQMIGPGLWDGNPRLVTQMPVSKVYSAILGVMGELSTEGIAKGQSATFEYGGKPRAFRGIDDVMQKLSVLLVKHKLLILPAWLETHQRHPHREAKERMGAPRLPDYVYTCVWRYKFIAVEDGSTHEIRTANETFDTSDKGFGKNMSYAYKYAMLQAFCVPVEGNEEQDAHSPVIGDEAPATSAVRSQRRNAFRFRRIVPPQTSLLVKRVSANCTSVDGRHRQQSPPAQRQSYEPPRAEGSRRTSTTGSCSPTSPRTSYRTTSGS